MEPDNSAAQNQPAPSVPDQQPHSPQHTQTPDPVQNQQITHAPEAKGKKKSKLLPVMLVIFFLLVLLFAGLIAWNYFRTNNESTKRQTTSELPTQQQNPVPTKDPTAGWQTYSSELITFKYPSNLIIDESPDNSISLYQTQDYLDKASNCSYLGQLNDPCPPPVFRISYQEYKNVNNLEELNATVGGGIADKTIIITSDSGTEWTVGPPLGLDLAPDTRSFTQDGVAYHFVEIRTYLVGLWRYLNNSTDNPGIKETQLLFDNTTLAHDILSTLTLTDTSTVNNPKDKSCIISGCNGEICAEESMSSICVYKEEFACYTSATCEVQSNGECGWTQTTELTSCLSETQ
jgi:hypothetical protein